MTYETNTAIEKVEVEFYFIMKLKVTLIKVENGSRTEVIKNRVIKLCQTYLVTGLFFAINNHLIECSPKIMDLTRLSCVPKAFLLVLTIQSFDVLNKIRM